MATNALERASLPAIKFISRLPPAVPIIVVFVLVLIGGFLGPWRAIAWGLVILYLAWMLALSWPRLTTAERLMRIAVIVLIAGLTIIQVIPR